MYDEAMFPGMFCLSIIFHTQLVRLEGLRTLIDFGEHLMEHSVVQLLTDFLLCLLQQFPSLKI